MIAEVNFQKACCWVYSICFKWDSFPSLPLFLHGMFEFYDFDAELVQTFRLRIAGLLFLFIAIKSVNRKKSVLFTIGCKK